MPTITYKPLQVAEEVHADQRAIQVVTGPWGSGKSTLAIFDCFLHARQFPRCDSLIVRDTYPALVDSCLRDFMQYFRDAVEINLGPPPTAYWKVGDMRGKIMFRSACDAEDVQKFQSVECGYCWMEEVCPGIAKSGATYQGISQEVFAGLFARVRQKDIRRRMILTSLPPPSTRHWFFRLFFDKKPVVAADNIDLSFLTNEIALHRVNPGQNLSNLPPGYYESQMPLLATKEQIQRFIFGDVGSAYAGFSMFPGWNDLLHLKRRLEPYPGMIYRGWDGGLSPACIWFQLTPTGKCLVLNEVHGEGVSIEELAPVVIAEGNRLFGSRVYQDYGDRTLFSRSQTDKNSCSDILRRVGIVLRPGVQSIHNRVQCIRGWLGRMDETGAKFLVHERCEALIEGFRGAYRRKVVAGVPQDEPEEDKSHPYSDVHDALQHALAAVTAQGQAERIGPTVMPPGPFGPTAATLRQNVIGQGRFHRKGR